ncbi:MAG: phosphonate C-P lyase system protein PhnL [Thermus sp.]|uniref:phosphonate C-P lyase system protein PhnL n=1 Tax=Thermus sp. TaxID=275 RepID=UPI0039189B5C
MSLLKVEFLSKQFNVHSLGRVITAFHGVSFTLDQGELKVVVGPSGAGKSSLLRCLYRTYRPTGGSALYFSLHGAVDLAKARDEDVVFLRREEIAYVTQFLRPRPRVPALELVAEPLLERGVDRDTALRQAGDWLEALGLRQELWNAYPTTFSGGEQQKVNLARALIRPSRLLLLDEPTASLDPQARAGLVERLKRLKAQGVGIIGVFHHLEDVEDLVDSTLELTPVGGPYVAEKP